MPDEHGLEGVVEVGYQLEIVQRHERDQLHVLDQGPQRQESHIAPHQHDELDDNDGDHHIVQSDSKVTIEGHLLV